MLAELAVGFLLGAAVTLTILIYVTVQLIGYQGRSLPPYYRPQYADPKLSKVISLLHNCLGL